MRDVLVGRWMPDKDPTTWSLATWALIIGMSALGGISRALTKVKECGFSSICLIGFLADLATSGLVGVATYMIMISFDYPVSMCAAAAGMSGHLATKIIAIYTDVAERFAGQIIPNSVKKDSTKKD